MNARDTVVALVTVAVGVPGAAGTVVAVMLEEAADAGPVPAAVFPTAVKVYAVADCNPVTVTGEDDVPAKLPGEEVTVYVLGIPPVAAFVTVTDAEPLLKALLAGTSVAPVIVGASAISAIFDAPAEASLYFLPFKFESDAFLVAITQSHFRMQRKRS